MKRMPGATNFVELTSLFVRDGVGLDAWGNRNRRGKVAGLAASNRYAIVPKPATGRDACTRAFAGGLAGIAGD
jgi:hypothetical protein